MHSAPSVIYPVGRSFWQGRIAAMLWLAGLAAALGFAVATEAGWPSVAIGLAVALAGAAGWYGTRTALQGRLQFDGRQWLWWPQALAGATPAEPQTLAALVVQVDLQQVLLLRGGRAGAPSLWLWLERRAAPALWDDVRRAVYSPASVAAPSP